MVLENYTYDPFPGSASTTISTTDSGMEESPPTPPQPVLMAIGHDEGNIESMLQEDSEVVGTIPRTENENILSTGMEEVIVIRVRDTDGLANNKTTEFVSPSNITLGEFMKDVRIRLGLSSTTFTLIYQSPDGHAYDLSIFPSDDVFGAMNIVPRRDKAYSLCLMKTKVRSVRKTKLVVRNLAKEFDSPNFQNEEVDSVPNVVSSSEPMLIDDGIPTQIVEDVDDDEPYRKEFVGLKNQQQTCYLNSLVQSLFFCPEFRNMIYNQVVPYDPEKKSIIAAFQKLFLHLQFSVRNSIETDELTRTFGWKDDHSFVQHDIEELYRAVMDFLGEELKRARKPALGESLFGGVMNDYVECLTCHKKKSKLELSLALSLPIRAFGQRLPEPTIEAALRSFIQFELMNHPNQYRCENCNTLVDAHKRISFEVLPYFLCIQLQRFEFDMNIMARRKINDRLAFPFVLNMNEFMDQKDEEPEELASANLIPPIDPVTIGSNLVKGPNERTSHSRPAANKRNFNTNPNNQQSIVHPYKFEKEVQKLLQEGPNVYKLLAVWVHEGGSSHRGHYYAYVFDSEKDSWYLCNDSVVRKSSEAEIMKTYGGGASYQLEEDEKGQAYMLIYRRCDEKLNILPMTWEELPSHMKDLWEEMEPVDKTVNETEICEKSIRRLRVYMRQMDGWLVDSRDAVINKNDSMREVAVNCYKMFRPGLEVDTKLVRVVRFNPDQLLCEESWDGREDETFGRVYRRPSDDGKEALLVEVTASTKPFESYTPNDAVFKVQLVKHETETVIYTTELHVPSKGSRTSVRQLKDKITKSFNLPSRNLFVAYRLEHNGLNVLLEDSDTNLQDYFKGSRYVELMTQTLSLRDVDKFLNFMSDYNGSYSFYVECQMPLPSLSEYRFSKESHQQEIRNVLATNFDTEPQFDFDPLDLVQVGQSHPAEKSEDFNTSRDFSDNSTSEESLTGSERTIVGFDSLGSSPSKVDAEESSGDEGKMYRISQNLTNGQGKENETEGPVSCNGGSSGEIGHYFRIVSRNRYASGWERIHIRVSSKMPLRGLSKKLQKEINVEEKNFIMFGVCGNEEHEYTYSSRNTVLEQLERFDYMKTRIGHRLGKSESRIPLYLLDLADYKRAPRHLADIVLASHMTGFEIKEVCRTELESIPGHNLDTSLIRIRKKKGSIPGRIIRDSTKYRDIFLLPNGELYVQVLRVPDNLEDNDHTILVRHWHPSRMVLDQPFELLLDQDHTQKLETAIGHLLSSGTGIDLQNLEYVSPDPDVEYPYDLHPVVLQEKLSWGNFKGAISRRLFIIYTDQCTIIVRDSTETARELTPAERRDYSKYHLDYGVSPRKSEQGLCINLARTPPA